MMKLNCPCIGILLVLLSCLSPSLSQQLYYPFYSTNNSTSSNNSTLSPSASRPTAIDAPSFASRKEETEEIPVSRFLETFGPESLMLLRRINDRLSNMEASENLRIRKLDSLEYRLTKVEVLFQERASTLDKIESQINRKVENLDWEMNKISTLLEVMREELEKIEKNQVQMKVEISKLDFSQLFARLSQLPVIPKEITDQGLGENVAKQQIILTTLYNIRRMTDSLQQKVTSIYQNLTEIGNTTRFIAREQRRQLTKEYFYGSMKDFLPESSSTPVIVHNYHTISSNSDSPNVSKDCYEILKKGSKKNGIYKIQPDGSKKPFFVYCDMHTDGGGWTVFQRRQDGSINFYREWRDYKYGFGNLASEHWLGNEKIHLLTNQQINVLRIDLQDFENHDAHAWYDAFAIGSETESYMIKLLGRYEGDAGDSFSYHASMKFSTNDLDNDPWEGGNCAEMHTGGWWYNGCDTSNLNGQYLGGEVTPDNENKGIYWYEWHGPSYSLRTTEMKIRPVDADVSNLITVPSS